MIGQATIFEYVVMILFLTVIIIGVVIFFYVFQIAQLNLEKERTVSEEALNLLEQFLSSEFITRGNSILDDAKLTAILSMDDFCRRMEKVMGGGDWFLGVRIVGRGERPCTRNYDPECTSWSICPQSRNFTAVNVPVNVYRHVGYIHGDIEKVFIPRYDPATLTVGVYR